MTREATIAGQLTALGFPSVSFGFNGDGPLLELATLREYGGTVIPSLVVWYLYQNDEYDLEAEIGRAELAGYLESANFVQGLPEKQAGIDTLWRQVLLHELKKLQNQDLTTVGDNAKLAIYTHEVLTFYYLRQSFRLSRNFVQETQGSSIALENLAKVDASVRAEADRLGVDVLAVYLPSFVEVVPFSYFRSPRVITGGGMLEGLGKSGIETANFADVLDELPDPRRLSPLRLPGHYNDEGYRLLAEFVAGVIEERLGSGP